MAHRLRTRSARSVIDTPHGPHGRPLTSSSLPPRHPPSSAPPPFFRLPSFVARSTSFGLLCLLLDSPSHYSRRYAAGARSAGGAWLGGAGVWLGGGDDAGWQSPPWLTVFTPLLIGRGLELSALPDALQARRRQAALTTKAAPAAPLEGPLGTTARELAWLLLSTLQLSLLPPYLEGQLHLRCRPLLTPMWLWLLLEFGLSLAAACSGGGGGGGAGAPPTAQDKVQSLWRTSARLTWLVTLGALALTLNWSASAIDAVRSRRQPALHLMLPLLFALAALVAILGCVWHALTHKPRRARPPHQQSSAVPPPPASWAASHAAGARARGVPTTSGGATPTHAGTGSNQPTTQRLSPRMGPGWFSVDAFPATEAETRMAEKIMEAAYESPTGPLPGAMPLVSDVPVATQSALPLATDSVSYLSL